ncbi:transposase [Streptomyces massasporeus]
MTTQAGDLELAIPKLRAGSFFPHSASGGVSPSRRSAKTAM